MGNITRDIAVNLTTSQHDVIYDLVGVDKTDALYYMISFSIFIDLTIDDTQYIIRLNDLNVETDPEIISYLSLMKIFKEYFSKRKKNSSLQK